MTFIASVKAKNGVAVIADSLVTTSRPIIEYAKWRAFITKQATTKKGNITLTDVDVADLFEYKPSFTKDYEDKLFEYGKYTIVTTAGSVMINNKKLSEIISLAYKAAPKRSKIDKIVTHFKSIVKSEVEEHTKNGSKLGRSVFIITHYDKAAQESVVYKVEVVPPPATPPPENYEFVEIHLQPKEFIVVCDGQNRISERILWGEMEVIFHLVDKLVDKMVADHNLTIPDIDSYKRTCFADKRIVTRQLVDDIKNNKLTHLSLQQAVDLAGLLMKIEIDIQKFTENIQTVGGVIKLVTIDEHGINHLLGYNIIKPNSFQK